MCSNKTTIYFDNVFSSIMKIGIICYPTYGGSGVLATELGKSLAQRGHQVHFITYRPPARLDRFQADVFYHEVRFAEYPLFDYPPYETALASKIVDVVKNEKLDILHVHYAIPHASAAYLAKKILLAEGIYIPVVTTLHGTDITLVGKDPAYAPVVTFAIEKSDGVTAVSNSLKEQTYQFFNVKQEIQVIHNFIDLNRFDKLNKQHFRQLIAPNGEKILLHVSNFRPVKRIEDVIHIFKNIVDKVPSKLLLVGDGPERQACERLTRELDLCNHVQFLGRQEAVEELLAISDLFILPSESESFGLAALEAMACGVPVISSDAGGLSEVNVNGVTGFLSPVGDVESMSKHTLALLSDDTLLDEFRANAYAHAQDFSIDKIVPQYEAFYQKIIATKVYVK